MSSVLTIEKMQLLKNPGASLVCDINPIVACGSVVGTPQASAFGFPNMIIGFIGFSVVATIGASMLAGARFARWFWLSFQVGTVFGISFITWLQFQTIFRINALCIFCIVTWMVMIVTFIYTTIYNLRERNIKVKGRWKKVSEFAQRNHGNILVSWYLVIALVILQHFWYYWSTLISR